MSTSALREDAAVPVGEVSAAALAWRYRGVVRVTAVAKATFAFALDDAMKRVPPQRVVRAEVHHGNDAARSVRLTTDLAPYLNRADVLLVGHAYAPPGLTGETFPVRLGVFDGAQPVLDKTVLVRPRGATRVPLVYERAYGGAGWGENPLGVGVCNDDGRSGEPGLLDPRDPKRRAGFGPIGQAWPARVRLLGALERWAPEGGGVLDLPDDLDWECCQAAPGDQRAGFLRGDEWIVMEGLHAAHALVRTRLPGARGVGLVYGLGSWGVAEGQPLELHPDTLRIDGDEETCTLTFRATFPIADLAALPSVRVALGVELPAEPVRWPEVASIPSPADWPEGTMIPLSSQDFEALSSSPLDGTMRFESSPEEDGSAVLLEKPPHAAAAGAPGAEAPPEPARAPNPRVPRDVERTFQSTLSIDFDSPKAPTLPFRAPTAPAQPAPSAQPAHPAPRPTGAARSYAHVRLSEDGGTMMQTPEDEAIAAQRSALPFAAKAPPAPAPPPPPPPAPPSPGLRRPSEPAPSLEATVAAPAPAARARPKAEGIELVNDTGLSFGALAWRMHPSRDCITVFARATCDIVPGGPARLRPAAEPIEGERFDAGALVYPTDRALFKVRADVVAVAEAHAARGPVRFMEARFAFGGEGDGFDRTVAVFGDRRWERGPVGDVAGEPDPFLVMPLRWDRAFGGPKLDANPAGIGYPDRMRRGPRLLPNVEDPGRRLRTPRQIVAPTCFAPIPLAWKDRIASRGRARDAWPLLPEDLDWTRFQAAPAAQQLGFLRGDESFLLAGVHARHPALEGALPGVRARCFAVTMGTSPPNAGTMGTPPPSPGAPGRVDEVVLRLDTVVFTVAELRIDLVFRGLLPVPDERAPDVRALHLFAESVEAPGMTLADARAKLLRS